MMQRENYVRNERVCSCGILFTPTGQNQKYCSKVCQRISTKEQTRLSHIKHLIKKGVRVGVGKGGTTGSGSDNIMWKHGRGMCLNRRAETKAKIRYCQHCGKDLLDATHYQWVIHHIDHNKYNNPEDGSNWTLLCKRCHQIEHKCWLALEGATTSLIRLPNGRYSRDERSSLEGSEAHDTPPIGVEGDDIV